MKPFIMAGTMIVTLALIFYTIAFITVKKKKVLSQNLLIFQTMGLIFDISATVCMILGTSNSGFTFHGALGYSALLMMLIETAFIWKVKGVAGINAEVPPPLNKFSFYSYAWWVFAFVTGGFLVAIN